MAAAILTGEGEKETVAGVGDETVSDHVCLAMEALKGKCFRREKKKEKPVNAFAGSRTRVNRLEGGYANRYTTNASGY